MTARAEAAEQSSSDAATTASEGLRRMTERATSAEQSGVNAGIAAHEALQQMQVCVDSKVPKRVGGSGTEIPQHTESSVHRPGSRRCTAQTGRACESTRA